MSNWMCRIKMLRHPGDRVLQRSTRSWGFKWGTHVCVDLGDALVGVRELLFENLNLE